jgi:hypothetical protein
MTPEPRTVALRRASTATALALALVLTVLALGAGLSPAGAAQAKPEVHPEWGKTFASDGVLKRSCRNYRYSYEIHPPEGDWALETFLTGPGGDHLASGAMVIGMDALTGTDRFRFCSASTRPGRFKIRAYLSVQDESGRDQVAGWLPVTRFRLRPRS